MIITPFRGAGGDEATGLAAVGRGKLALVPDAGLWETAERPSIWEPAPTGTGEQGLLDHITQTMAAAGYTFSRTLVVEYYVSLKTNPFVILTGATGHGKTEFVQLFAEALVGYHSAQYALIPGGTSWHHGTGVDSYYRSLHERFCSWRFLELLQEAGDPGNAGKVYLICFDSLHPHELEYYFATLLQIAPDGQKRLNLPGFPDDEQPVVPPNVFITATVDTSAWPCTLSRAVLCHAGVIEFRAPAPLGPESGVALLPPPVGYQRLWLRAAVTDVETARQRLVQLLGADQLSRLRCSPDLARLLWRAGAVLSTQTLQELTAYIANSFDANQQGLFVPEDRYQNAQMAFDAQVVQRVLWRLHASSDAELRRDLVAYLDRMAARPCQQAVA